MACSMAAVLALGALTGCSMGREQVFKIDGETCSLSEAKVLLVNYQNQYTDLYGVNLWEASDEQKNRLETYVKDLTVTELAEVYTMELIGEEKEIFLTEEEQTHAQAAAEEYFASLNEAEKTYMDVSQKDIEALYARYAAAKKVYQSLTESVDQEVSDDEARVMRAKQIFVKSEDTAKLVKQKLAGGEDFDTLAASCNESEKVDVTLDRSQVDKENQDTVFALKDKEVSEVIPEDGGYYIFQCVKSYDPKLTEANKEKVLAGRMEDTVNSTYDSYVKEANSKLNQECWDGVKLDTSGALKTSSFFEVFEKHCGKDF